MDFCCKQKATRSVLILILRFRHLGIKFKFSLFCYFVYVLKMLADPTKPNKDSKSNKSARLI